MTVKAHGPLVRSYRPRPLGCMLEEMVGFSDDMDISRNIVGNVSG